MKQLNFKNYFLTRYWKISFRLGALEWLLLGHQETYKAINTQMYKEEKILKVFYMAAK